MRSAFLVALLVAMAALVVVACQKASESTEGKRMPKPPPPASGAPSTSLSIAVDVDGNAGSAIDAAKLDATPPDYRDEEHRAWKLSTLVGPSADRDGSAIAVTGQNNMTIVMRTAKTKADSLPVLSINRRGEVMVGMVSPDQPFPAYHGRGGRLNRPGDPLPRIAAVTKIRVYREGDAAP